MDQTKLNANSLSTNALSSGSGSENESSALTIKDLFNANKQANDGRWGEGEVRELEEREEKKRSERQGETNICRSSNKFNKVYRYLVLRIFQ